MVDLLRVLLKSCAARNGVAPRLIADGDDLERLAVEDAPDVAAMRGWRYELFGVSGRKAQTRRAGAQDRPWRGRVGRDGCGRRRGSPKARAT